MKKNSFLLNLIYLWILGACIGAILACGTFVAPVIFKAYTLLPDLGITQYDSGILMTQVFLKLGTFLNYTAIFIIIYRIFSLDYSTKSGIFALVLDISSVSLIFLFTLYYASQILKAQQIGAAATGTPEFASLHSQSETTFKILFLLLSLSFIYHFFRFCQAQKSAQEGTQKGTSA